MMAEPFKLDDIRKAAAAIWGVNLFDTERLVSDDFFEGDSEDKSDDLQDLERESNKKGKKSGSQDRKVQKTWQAMIRVGCHGSINFRACSQ